MKPMHILRFILTAAVIISDAITPSAHGSWAKTSEIRAGWHFDLRFMAKNLVSQHANAYHLISRTAFDSEVAALDKKIPTMDLDTFFVGLDQIENSIGDGHTYLRIPSTAPLFGLEFKRFGADYRLVSVVPNGKEAAALGTRLLSVDGVAVTDIHTRLLTLTPADETQPLRELRAQALLNNGLILHGLGITANDRTARFVLENDQGTSITLQAHSTQLPPRPAWLRVIRPTSSPEGADEHGIACNAIAPGTTIYCNFRTYDGLQEGARRLFAEIRATGARRLIIDMRENGGGNFCDGLRFLVEPIVGLPAVNHHMGLFVLIGPQTFSAAMSNAVHFRELTHAVLVGEPIGEKPNSYQEIRDLTLPRTGWVMRYSTRLYHFTNDKENLVRPDVRIASTWADYLTGRDPVLDYVLALPMDDPVGNADATSNLKKASESVYCSQAH